MHVWSEMNYKNLMKFIKTLQAIWKHFWTKMDLDPAAKRDMIKLQWPRHPLLLPILRELFITWFICLYGAGKYTSIVQFFLNMFAAQLCTRSPIPKKTLKITKRLIEIFRLNDLNLKCVYFLSKCPLCNFNKLWINILYLSFCAAWYGKSLLERESFYILLLNRWDSAQTF